MRNCHIQNKLYPAPRYESGFSLLEVVLALGITIGLLVVVLSFYQQASRVRTEALRQSEVLASARLFMDRLTAELRSSRVDSYLLMGLQGTSNSMELVSAQMPKPPAWSSELLDVPLPASSDLKIISYTLNYSAEETNVTGISRAHEALLELPPSSRGLEDDFIDLTIEEEVDSTNQTSVSGTGGPRTRAVPSRLGEISGEEFITDQLLFLQFRYCNGRTWLDEWNAEELPWAVEIQLGIDPLPADALPEEYPYEFFRRVVYLPTCLRTTNDLANPDLEEFEEESELDEMLEEEFEALDAGRPEEVPL